MRPKTAITIAVVLLLCIAADVTVRASSFDVDKLLQFLAWSAITSDYNMSIDIVKQPLYKEYNGVLHILREGNPMFYSNPEFFGTFTDMKNALVEIAPDVLPKPWSTLALLGVCLTSGQAVVNNNQVFETVGEPIQITLAYRYRW